jgi:predicted esterase
VRLSKPDIEENIMKCSKHIIFVSLLIFFLGYIPLQSQSSPQPDELKIFETDKKITIDGDLEDWEGIDEFPINLTTAGDKIEPSEDLTVTARFTYDAKNFYAAIKAIDNIFEFPSRSWRYGDGLLLTFLDPYQGNQSDRFYSFGICLEEKNPVKVLVNKDGVYFPGIDVRQIDLQIIPDEKTRTIIYELAIPFKYLVPFKPFLQDRWGINLIYADSDLGQRKLALLYPDTGYDTELSDKRKGAIFQFVHHVPKDAEIQMALNAFHFYHDDEKTITLAVNSPDDRTGWEMRTILLGPGAENIPDSETFNLKKGMNILRFNLEEKDYATGSYDFSVGVVDDKDTLIFKEDNRFFILNRKEFGQFQSKLEGVEKSALDKKDEKFLKSLPNLEIRFDWIKEYMDEASSYEGIAAIDEWYDEIKTLFENVDKGEPAVFPLGSIGRYAHRSGIDGTLQPYTVYIPRDYNEDTPTPLFVALHGSGVNEISYALNIATLLEAARVRRGLPRMIMIAPKARGFSDWYLGDSGKDVLECMDHIKALYNIDEKNIVLQGFSMGGYGAWRLSLLNPGLFKAIVIQSGAISPPPYLKGENILDLLDRGKGSNFLIVHGAKDNAVPVDDARKAVQKLKELGIKHKYIEVKDGFHVGYNKWDEIFDWIRDVLGIKPDRPPRKRRRD